MEKTRILVILGQTASGKSDVAVKLAKIFNGEVVSADSRQVYKGLDIGTGKITKLEMKGVRHYLIDVADPKKRFTASDFVKLTIGPIGAIVKSGKIPIVCGGTGFYIDALLGDKQIPEVPPNPALRKKLEKKTAVELFEELKKLDPERAKNIDAKNPRRLVRAIEICRAIGKVPRYEARDMRYEALKIGIRVEEKELKERINKRIKKWFKKGLLKEVRDLHSKGLSWKRMAEIGLEYKIVAEYLQGKISKKEMTDRMQAETWQYARRQRLWFKDDKETDWFEPNKIKKIEMCVKKFLNLI